MTEQTTGMLINLDELEESVESTPPAVEEEPYEVVDVDPSLHLPQSVVEEILNDEELQPLQEELDYIASTLAAVQNRLQRAVQTKINQRKQQMIEQKKAEREELVMEGMSNPDTLRAMAVVAELMQTMPGVVLEALDTLKNGGAPASVMQRITSSLIPSVEPYSVEEPQPTVQQAAAQSDSKPFKSKKWSPNG